MAKEMEKLSPGRARIQMLDSKGHTTTEIAEMLHVSLAYVSRTKRQLRSVGIETSYRPARLRDDPTPDMADYEGCLSRSEFEPEDDELPDLDEPAMTVERCQCGLILPCHHEPIQVLRSHWPESDFPDVEGVEGASIENGKRRANRKRKKEQLTATDTNGQPASEEGQGLDNELHAA